MLFLMNDRILDLKPRRGEAPIDPARFHALSLPHLVKLGQEMFADSPMMHREDPERARRLAQLIVAKAPEVNAALFIAPALHCRPCQVMHRFTTLGGEVMKSLRARDRSGGLNPVTADREVWRRMAA